MPRVSQEVSQQTRKRIIDSAFNIVLKQGISGLTFTNLAKEAGISRSGINAHFKKKEDILKEIEPLMIKIITTRLDFSSPDKFWDSWVYHIDNSEQFRNAIEHIEGFVYGKESFDKFVETIQGDRNECTKVAYQAAGYAAVNIPHYKSLDDSKSK